MPKDEVWPWVVPEARRGGGAGGSPNGQVAGNAQPRPRSWCVMDGLG